MSAGLLGVLVAGIISITGWILNYILSGMADRRRQRLMALLNHMEEQLRDLYGPMAFLALEGRQSAHDLMRSLGRTYPALDPRPFTEEEVKLWLLYVEQDWFPRSEKIKELLTTKTHLIEGGQLSQSYLNFLDYYNTWKMEHMLWRQAGVRYLWHTKVPWAKEFEDEVLSTFARLKSSYAMLLGKSFGPDMPQ
jgi:hypothetical protein